MPEELHMKLSGCRDFTVSITARKLSLAHSVKLILEIGDEFLLDESCTQ